MRMYPSEYALFLSALSMAHARFGQENPLAIQEIAAVTSGGEPGQAATIAGGAISDLLAAANPCAKLQTGDEIIATLGTGEDALSAAKNFVAAEQNFNPFNQDKPTLCSDPALPTTQELRGIVPKIDPAVGGSELANQLSAQSINTPFDATGLSVADVFAAQGFTNFTTRDSVGNEGSEPTTGAGAGGAANSSTTDTSQGQNSSVTASSTTTLVTMTGTGQAGTANTAVAPFRNGTAAADAGSAAATGQPSFSNQTTAAAATASGQPDEGPGGTGAGDLDFGKCNPTIRFEGGLGGRPADEFTFQSNDPAIEAIQQEALNPNIITNRVCDELVNQCGASQAALDTCAQAKAKVEALGSRDQAAADTFNQALGF